MNNIIGRKYYINIYNKNANSNETIYGLNSEDIVLSTGISRYYGKEYDYSCYMIFKYFFTKAMDKNPKITFEDKIEIDKEEFLRVYEEIKNKTFFENHMSEELGKFLRYNEDFDISGYNALINEIKEKTTFREYQLRELYLPYEIHLENIYDIINEIKNKNEYVVIIHSLDIYSFFMKQYNN